MAELEAAPAGRVEIGLVCDSPRLGHAIRAALCERGVAATLLPRAGNRTSLPMPGEPDLPDTIAVAYHAGRLGAAMLETIGAMRATGKRVVGLRIGEIGAGAAEERDMWRARMTALGAISVHSPRALIDAAIYVAGENTGRTSGARRVAIVTFGGGSGVLAADLCAQYGLETPSPTEPVAQNLAALVPPIASIGNPFDLTPEMLRPQWFENFVPVLKGLGGEYDTLFIQLSAMAMGGEAMAHAIGATRRCGRAEIVVAWTLAPPKALEVLRSNRIFAFSDPMRAAATLAAVGNSTSDIRAGAAETPCPGSFSSVVADCEFSVHQAENPGPAMGMRLTRLRHAEFGSMIGCAPGGALARRLGGRPVYGVAPMALDEARHLLERSPVLAAMAKIERVPIDKLARAIAAFSGDPGLGEAESVTIGWGG